MEIRKLLEKELTEYIKNKHTQEECSGFIDGFERVCDILEREQVKQQTQTKQLQQADVSVSVCELDALKDGYCENYRCKADCIGCDFWKQNVH